MLYIQNRKVLNFISYHMLDTCMIDGFDVHNGILMCLCVFVIGAL